MEDKTQLDSTPPFTPTRLEKGELKNKWNISNATLGASVLGAILGGGATLFASYYAMADDVPVPIPPNNGHVTTVQEHPLPPADITAGIADICHLNLDGYSFSKAFATARNECGPGAVFVWHGKAYNTYIKEEWQGMNEAQKHDFGVSVANLRNEINEVIADSGYHHSHGHIIYDNHPPHTTNMPHTTNLPHSKPTHFAVDRDRDGYCETIVFLDKTGKVERVAIDTDHDGYAESYIDDSGRVVGIIADGGDENPDISPNNTIPPPQPENDFEGDNVSPPIPPSAQTGENEFSSNESDFDPNSDMSDYGDSQMV